MDDHILLMKTLADPTRLKIFKLVLFQELCVCELQSLLGISQPAVSQHIAKLKGAGLLRERKAGMWTYYQGDMRRAAEGLGAVISFLGADPATIPEINELVEGMKQIDRLACCEITKGAVRK